jgi:hypothetical protein
MKWLLFLFLLTPLLHAAGGEGAWSKPVQGLQARLVISPSHEPELDKTFDVILELQEVGIETSMGRTHDFITLRLMEKEEIGGSVADANGHPIAVSGPLDFDQFLRNWDEVVPPKGHLSFPIGSVGSKPHAPHPGQASAAGTLLGLGMQEWIIPFTGGPYYLSGTLTVAKPPRPLPSQHEEPYRGWTGQMALPPVELPAK